MPPPAADARWDEVRRSGRLAVVLVRHGRTAYNHERRFLGRTDIELDATGLAQAEAVGRALAGSLEAVYASPLARAWQTAQALAPPAPVAVPDLQELDQGELDGLRVDEAVARWPTFFARWQRDPGAARVPGGETLSEGRDRALAALHGVVAAHTGGGTIGVVAHQLVLASVLCTLSDEPLSGWRRHGLPNGGIAVVAWDGSRFHIVQQRGSAPDGGSSPTDV